MSGGFQGSGAGGGDVTAALNLGDEFVIRGDGPGKGVQNSLLKIDDLGNLTEVNEITVNGAPMFKIMGHSTTTSLVAGGQLIPNGGDTTLYDVLDGQGVITDPFSDPNLPEFKQLTWSGLVGNLPAHAATFETFVAIQESATPGIGEIVEQSTPFSIDQGRDLIILGDVSTPDGLNLGPIGNFSRSLGDGYLSTDLAEAIGIINTSGNTFAAGGADLTISRSVGSTFRENINRFINAKDPNNKPSAADPVVSFFRIYNDGSGGATFTTLQTSIDPDQWDDATGTLATMPGGNNWQNKILYFLPDGISVVVQYGEETYSSFDDAVNAIATLEFTQLNDALGHDVVRSILTVKSGSTNLTADLLAGTAKFSPTGKFGFSIGSGGGSGGGGAQDLQITYDNSVTPEILTDGTRGPLSIKIGTGDDTDDVFEAVNIAGTKTFSIQGDGTMTTDVGGGASVVAFPHNTINAFGSGKVTNWSIQGVEKAYVNYLGNWYGGGAIIPSRLQQTKFFDSAGAGLRAMSLGGGLYLDDDNTPVNDASSSIGSHGFSIKKSVAVDVSFQIQRPTTDLATSNLIMLPQRAYIDATTNLVGGDLILQGAEGAVNSAGLAHGGDILVTGATGYGTGNGGDIILEVGPASGSGIIGLIRLVGLPTSDPGNDGVWDDASGHVAIGPGN